MKSHASELQGGSSNHPGNSDLENGESLQDHTRTQRYPIPATEFGAVEIPAIVENIDRAILAFGRVPDLRHALNPDRTSLPLYLNPESPFCKPFMSHNTRSNNVVLKVTVPKRTGRKRKRGSSGPWQGDVQIPDEAPNGDPQVCSIGRLDDPTTLRRKLQDNIDRYHVEAVGTIKHTHRFRGLGDFYWDMSRSDFAQRYVNQVLPGDSEQIKNFRFLDGHNQGPQVDILPPPMFTHMPLPFIYQYSQNPYVRTTEDGETINVTAVKVIGYFVGAEEPAPTGPQTQPNMNNPQVVRILAEIKKLFEERPIWTRRSLMNRLGSKISTWNELRRHLNYVAYQFKGGPWRDAVIPYGLDPRTSPDYRQYQTVMFKLQRLGDRRPGQSWHSARREEHRSQNEIKADSADSHLFDGQNYSGDAKLWQVCDITDPLLRKLLDDAKVRANWDIVSGWYHGGLWAKIKGIMKTKLVAIKFNRKLQDSDFTATLRVADASPVRNPANPHGWHLPLPNLNLTQGELEQMGKNFSEGKRNRYATGYVTRQRDILRGRWRPAQSVPSGEQAQEDEREGIEQSNGEHNSVGLTSDSDEEDDEDGDEDDGEEEEEDDEDDKDDEIDETGPAIG